MKSISHKPNLHMIWRAMMKAGTDNKLRSATLSDAPEIARILRVTRQYSLPYLPDLHAPDEDRAFIRDIVLVQSRVFLAEIGHDIVGFCAYRRGWIDHLYVLPEFQGRAIGTALLAHAKSDNDQLELWAFQKNRQAIDFYVKRGFVCVEKTDGSCNEEKEPDARLVWSRARP